MIYVFDKRYFSPSEVDAITQERAHDLAQAPKSERRVFEYLTRCSTFASDFNRGSIPPEEYYIKTF